MSGSKKNESKEESCSCYAESRTKESCAPIRNVTHPLRYYEFTQEEMKALEECDRESFYGRCLPFSAILASLTYAAIKNDILRTHQHFGPVPKMMAAAIVGYVLGRLSYQGRYDERLRELPPNSHLGNVLRKYHAANNPPPKPAKK
ncbi:hypothetical protein PYW08_000034 [Mythimna loreyi]|uniref:Uncharacterized protein n=1 Tax=Mythimna loreyi TaxID=667449 RepID=A0ACC2RAU2_9NEOP|nr:hypothetical protein PYW08_000034 [Mythimna loreyi]